VHVFQAQRCGTEDASLQVFIVFPIQETSMKTLAAMIACALAWHVALAQTMPQAPASDNAAPPGSNVQPPLEPMPPDNGPTGNIDAGPSTPPSITTPRIESSGGGSTTQSEAGVENVPPPSPISRLKPMTRGDVTYLCGGVGAEEADHMKSEARNYDMLLTFAAKDGSYLADVSVDITDAKGGAVLQASCDAPMLLVDVPKSGTYRVHAQTAGYSLDRTAKVVAHRRKGQGMQATNVVFVWPQQVAEMGGAAPATGGSGNAGSGSAGGSSKP
jgi:hypothetical protein